MTRVRLCLSLKLDIPASTATQQKNHLRNIRLRSHRFLFHKIQVNYLAISIWLFAQSYLGMFIIWLAPLLRLFCILHCFHFMDDWHIELNYKKQKQNKTPQTATLTKYCQVPSFIAELFIYLSKIFCPTSLQKTKTKRLKVAYIIKRVCKQ